MSEPHIQITINDLKRGMQLIDPDGWILKLEGHNQQGYCIVSPLDKSGPSTTVSLESLNKDLYKIHSVDKGVDSMNFYDIFSGLILQDKDGKQLYIREIGECKVVVESEEGNDTVTSLEDLKIAEYRLLKPKQVPEERVIALTLNEGQITPMLGLASNVVEFGYSFLKFTKLVRVSDPEKSGAFKFIDGAIFHFNYHSIQKFIIFENIAEAEKRLFKDPHE